MQSRFIRQTVFVLAVVVGLSVCLIDANAQTRRKRRPRRAARPVITNPAIAPPATDQMSTAGGEKIISTADETPDANAAEGTLTEQDKAKKAKPSPKSDEENIQQTINTLSNQVNKLTDKLSQMQENERSLLDMERLSRAEQRAEGLRSQQVEVESKLADLQSRLEQTEYWLKPENVERSTATYGSTRPEEARESRRRQLESEKSRLQAQIKILETSRIRLEAAVATADAEVDLLRRRLETQRAQEESSASPQPEPRPSTNRKRPE
jgi:DNA repair exonuclease SbcCD ATPase subunit